MELQDIWVTGPIIIGAVIAGIAVKRYNHAKDMDSMKFLFQHILPVIKTTKLGILFNKDTSAVSNNDLVEMIDLLAIIAQIKDLGIVKKEHVIIFCGGALTTIYENEEIRKPIFGNKNLKHLKEWMEEFCT